MPRSRIVATVTKRELGAYFYTPVAYVAGGVFLVASSLVFFSLFFVYGRAELTRFFELLPLFFALLIPALGMRQFVPERRQGMYEVLTTLPVSETELLLGKSLALWVVTAILLLPTACFAITVGILGRLDPGPVLSGYFGALLLSAAYTGLAILSATISRSVVVSLTLGVALAMLLASVETVLPVVPEAAVPVLRTIAVTHHVGEFARGIVSLTSIVYLLSVAAAALTIARHTVRRRS